jgi:hypothetical protein
LFYRTLNGAEVGDLYMSLIHTCQLCDVNSLDYLIELQRHAQDLTTRPAEWMPWNYRQTLTRVGVTGVNQAHIQVTHLSSIECPIEQCVLPVQNGPLQCPFHDVMPTPGLCRVGGFPNRPAFVSMLSDAA